MAKIEKPTKEEITKVMAFYQSQGDMAISIPSNDTNTIPQNKKFKIKKYRIRRFFQALKMFFYNEKDHALRKGPILIAFFLNILAITCVIGWSVALKFAKGGPVDMKEFAWFMGCAAFVGLNLYSMFKSNTMAIPVSLSASTAGITPNVSGTLTSVMNTVMGKPADTNTKSPSTPALGPNVPPNTKVATGDNR
jgi:hypothetical protein